MRSNSNFEPSMDNACPHDGWYNGNPKLMIENGTYADYRFKFEQMVGQKKIDQEMLDEYDRLWESIPIDDRRAARARVIEQITPKQVKLRDGKIVMKAQPSDNGRSNMPDPKFRKSMKPATARGSLLQRPDPLAQEAGAAAVAQAKEATAQIPPAVKTEGKGNPVPTFAPDVKLPKKEAPSGVAAAVA